MSKRVQLSRRRVAPRRPRRARGGPSLRHAVDRRPRRRVRCTACVSRGTRGGTAGARRRRRGDRGSPVGAARRRAERVSQPLPPDHPWQAARAEGSVRARMGRISTSMPAASLRSFPAAPRPCSTVTTTLKSRPASTDCGRCSAATDCTSRSTVTSSGMRRRSRVDSMHVAERMRLPLVATNDVRHARPHGRASARRPHLHPSRARRSTPPGVASSPTPSAT